ncbi:MAG: hypothetical protein IJ153_05615 [Clostridia bacterium]|nr:hypothetical protein [Clostridia bacterium]MBQ9211162.1 hypothetical protein [Clostridia bacterium]
MKLFDLLKVIDGRELVSVWTEDRKRLALFECDDVVDRSKDGVVFVREENNDCSLLDKEVCRVYVAVIDDWGLPGVHVIVK